MASRGAYCITEGRKAAPAGTVVAVDGESAVVACGEGGLVLEEVEGASGPLPVGARLG